MKILLLAPQPFYQERGTPIAVRLLAGTLAELGHEVHLLVYAEGDDIAIPGVTIHRHMPVPGIADVPPGFSFKKLVCDFFMFCKGVRLARKLDIQLVHAVEESAFMAVALKKMFGIPFVYDMDSCLSDQLTDTFSILRLLSGPMRWLEKIAVRQSIGIVAVCRDLEELVEQVAPGTMTVRLEDISLLADGGQGQEDLRERLGLKGIMILYVGNLEKYQGIDLLLQSFHQALSIREDLNMVLIGGSKEHIEKYSQQVKVLGMESKVFFCGPRPVSMLGYYLKQADILVSPRTKGNNTPMKIYSYLDSGVPVLATNLPTHTQVLDPGIAFLVDPGPDAMAQGIVNLAGDGTLRRDIGMKARQRVHEEYSLPAYKRKLAAFYGQLAV